MLTSNSTEAMAAAEEAAPTDSGPTGVTPGSGRLAALLAEKRASAGVGHPGNTGKPDSGPIRVTPSHQERVTPAGGAFDAFEITAVGGSTGDKQSDVDQVKGSGVVRPTRVTPGSGRLAALLAQTRAEAAKTAVPDTKAIASATVTSERTTQSGPVFDEPEVTEVDAAAREKTPDGKTDLPETSVAIDSRPTRITPAGGGLNTLLASTRTRIGKQDIHDRKTPIISTADVLNVSGARVVAVHSVEPTASDSEVSSAQKKNSGFTATLLGVPAPVVDPSGPVDMATGKNAAAPGDTSEATTFGERVSVPVSLEDRPFRVDVADVVKPSRRSRVVVGLALGAAIVVAAVVLIVPRSRTRPETSSLTLPVPSPAVVVVGQSAPVIPTADPPVGANSEPGQPRAVPAVAAEQPAAVPVAATDPRVAVPAGGTSVPTVAMPAAASPAAVPAAAPAPAEQPPVQVEAKSELKSNRKSEGKSENENKMGAQLPEASASEDVPSTEPARKVRSRAESRESAVRKTAAKTRRKTQIIRAAAEEFVRGGASVGAKTRQKISTAPVAGRPADEDPDAVLPLSRH